MTDEAPLLTLSTRPGGALLTDPFGSRLLEAVPGPPLFRGYAGGVEDEGGRRNEMVSLTASADIIYTAQIDGAIPGIVTARGHCTGAV